MNSNNPVPRFALVAASLLLVPLPRAAFGDGFHAPRLGVVCETPAQAKSGVAKSRAWEQSLLTGNGAMGAMVPGELAHEEIFLSHALAVKRINNPQSHPFSRCAQESGESFWVFKEFSGTSQCGF